MTPAPLTTVIESLSRCCSESMIDGEQGVAWRSAVAAGDFDSALLAVEESLSQTPDCPAARLWWVRCQLELGRVPITALTSPLEELLPQLRELSVLSMLSAYTYLRAALGLLERSQSRLAVSILERALEFCQSCDCLSQQQIDEISKFYAATLEEEINRAQQRRENKKYIGGLQEKLESTKGKKAKRFSLLPENGSAVESRKRRESPSAKSIIAAAMQPPVDGSTAKKETVEAPAVDAQMKEPAFVMALSGAESSEIPAPAAAPSSSRPFPFGLILILIFGISIVGSSVYLLRLYRDRVNTAQRLAMEIRLPAPRLLELPSITSAAGLGAGQTINTTLDAVGKRLQQLAFSKGKDAPAAKPGEEPAKEAEIDQQALNSEQARKLPEPKAAELKTEEDELESISRVPAAQNAIPESKIAKPDSQKFSKTPVEDVGTSPRKAPVPSDVAANNNLKVTPEGRVWGPPQPVDSAPAKPGSRSLDGSPVQSYEVQQYNPPLRYRTLAPTEVLSAPSLLAKSLAHLETQTPIDVTARMGQWLELRSAQGRVGYIYSQDAVEDRARK